MKKNSPKQGFEEIRRIVHQQPAFMAAEASLREHDLLLRKS